MSEQIAGVQRARVLSAMVEECCERGAGNVSVAHVVKRSGISRRTFYQMFGDRQDCFAASFEQALALATERVAGAYDRRAPWRERIRSGLVALLSFLDEEPRLGRVLIVESLSGGPTVAARRGEVVAKLARLVDEGRLGAKSESGLSALTSEGIVGAVLGVLQARLADADHEPLLGLASELTSMTVLPYLGASAARRELERPVPIVERAQRGGPQPLLSDPFKEAGKRLTYRTAQVLMATADHPGASNRMIGQLAKIADQGQVSKLLRRLARIGLVSNSGLGPGNGAPNAWTLTPTGEQVVSSIRAHSEGNGHGPAGPGRAAEAGRYSELAVTGEGGR